MVLKSFHQNETVAETLCRIDLFLAYEGAGGTTD